MDPSIKIDGCPRAWVAGLSLTLNIWVWLGRVVYVVPFLLWIAFLAVLIRQKHLVEALIGLAGIGLIVVALMATQPIIECLWTEFPPTLIFVNPCQISSIAALCSLGRLAAGIRASLTLPRIRANTLAGLDGLVFTGGIGEHAPEIRQRICDRLSWLGVSIDAAANAQGAQRIAAMGSPVDVLIVPTNEEVSIARHCRSLLVTGR